MKLYRKPGEPLWYSSDLKDWDLPGVGIEISKEQAHAIGAFEETALEWEDVLAGAYDPIIAGGAWQAMDYGDAEAPSLDDSFQHLLKRPKFGFCFDILSMHLNDRALDYWIDLVELKEALAKFRDALMEKLEASQKGISRSLVEKLVRFNLCPALDKAAPENVAADFSSLGKSDFVAEFDYRYWSLKETLSHSKWLRAVDVVRVVLRLWPNKLRVSEGESLVLRQTHLKLHLQGWPFCELCWRFAEAADSQTCKDGMSHSDRYCRNHKTSNRSEHEKLVRKRKRFLRTCVALRAEANQKADIKDALLGLYFDSNAGTHALERAVRYTAFHMVQFKTSTVDRLFRLAKLDRQYFQEQGIRATEQWLADQIGVKKQSVNMLLETGGRIDLESSNILLRWWPPRASPPLAAPIDFSPKKTRLNP